MTEFEASLVVIAVWIFYIAFGILFGKLDDKIK